MIDCLVNGELGDRVSAADRGLHYGDGLFETIAVIDGQPRFWQGHMDRLAAGCERLGLPVTPQAVLLREVQTVCAGRTTCMVKILLTRGASNIGFQPRAVDEASRVVCSFPWPLVEGNPEILGVDARICELRLGIQPELAGINHLNRLEQVRARAEWNDSRIHEGILLDREDHVVSAIRSNIFLVCGGLILTPRLDRCGIRGVMRAAILAAFRERCEQRRIGIDMLPEADEIFICNTLHGIYPLKRIDHWEYEVGHVTREVQEWLSAQ
ncbi:MAG: aminodeoxychorismate lyase [Xanthomonadales bacterium]|jgi:4-amino-4-deoxychorismate lyase|nr:aminodeoxychorismate lyase [Xanthomonadales bacterium]